MKTPKIPKGWRRLPIGAVLKRGDKLHFDDGLKPEWETTLWAPGTILTRAIIKQNGIYIRRTKSGRSLSAGNNIKSVTQSGRSVPGRAGRSAHAAQNVKVLLCVFALNNSVHSVILSRKSALIRVICGQKIKI
jgi:hypothetical protein